jgi:hypothetical protein
MLGGISIRKVIIMCSTLIALTLLYSYSTQPPVCPPTEIEDKLLTETFNNGKTTLNSYEELDKLPQEYPFDLAQKNGDIVYNGSKRYNIEKLERFIEDFKLKKSGTVRITIYTKEGDAVISDLTTNNGNLKLIVDSTRDEYADKENRKKVEYNVVDILKKYENNGISYTAKIDDENEKLLFFTIIK